MDAMDHTGMDAMDHTGMDAMDHTGMDAMDHTGMDAMDHTDHTDHSGGHSMVFTTDTVVSLWLRKWGISATERPGEYAGALIGLALMGVFNELLVMVRTKLHMAYFPCGTEHSCNEPEPDVEGRKPGCCFSSRVNPSPRKVVPTVLESFADATRPFGKVVVSAIYTLNVLVGYLLMLVAMTMDVGVFFAVVGGIGLGHLVFFRKPTREMSALMMAGHDGCGCASQ